MKTIRLGGDVTDGQVAEFEDLRRRLLGYQEWERLPHQHPPVGDWFGWILEGGRGSGKSIAANLATRDHLNGSGLHIGGGAASGGDYRPDDWGCGGDC